MISCFFRRRSQASFAASDRDLVGGFFADPVVGLRLEGSFADRFVVLRFARFARFAGLLGDRFLGAGLVVPVRRFLDVALRLRVAVRVMFAGGPEV
jgi:hypothetical protein